jgi:hypothetical protein
MFPIKIPRNTFWREAHPHLAEPAICSEIANVSRTFPKCECTSSAIVQTCK